MKITLKKLMVLDRKTNKYVDNDFNKSKISSSEIK
jgi:hypothetical protein